MLSPGSPASAGSLRRHEHRRRAHRGARIALLGHSMGGRVALRLAGEPDVVGVCALAPWTTPDDPVEQLTGRIVHGDRNRTTPPETSLTYSHRARRAGATLRRHVITGSGHAMLRRTHEWNAQVSALAADCATARCPR